MANTLNSSQNYKILKSYLFKCVLSNVSVIFMTVQRHLIFNYVKIGVLSNKPVSVSGTKFLTGPNLKQTG